MTKLFGTSGWLSKKFLSMTINQQLYSRQETKDSGACSRDSTIVASCTSQPSSLKNGGTTSRYKFMSEK